MPVKNWPRTIIFAFVFILLTGKAGWASNFINWQPWSEQVFSQAKTQKKLILLDLHAVWCHWCHVMDNQTYKNPAVINVIKNNFIPVSVDQDSRPDLSVRYQDYGWPATVIYNSQGNERKILSGYIAPAEFAKILQECIKYPDKIETVAAKSTSIAANESPAFSKNSEVLKSLIKILNQRYVKNYDTKSGGWTDGDKYLPADNVEYAMVLAYDGDKLAEKRAREVLDLQKHLLDPVWGGVYQYSTDNDWLHPHYEKIMSVQADNLRIYSLAYLLFQDKSYIQAARKIYQYLGNFLLSPEGPFYTSQDADLIPGERAQNYFALNARGRQKLGIPKIDKHIYSRENGWAIEALTYFYIASGDKKCLDLAKRSALWVITNRQQNKLQDQSDLLSPLLHEKQSVQIYLSDNLSMAKALLCLYAVTGDKIWLDRASKLADIIIQNFQSPTGFKTAGYDSGVGKTVDLDDNVNAARFFNLIYHYSGQSKYKDSAYTAMRYVTIPAIAKKRYRLVAGILLANKEIANDPFHTTIVGAKGDTVASQLFTASQQYPLAYRETQWLDPKEGTLPGQDIEYPQLDKAAAYVCTSSTCSRPLFTIDDLKQKFSDIH